MWQSRQPATHGPASRCPVRRLPPKLILLAFAILALLAAPLRSHAAVEGRECEVEPTDDLIDYRDLITCAITPVGDSDLFRFEGVVGERIFVNTARTGGGVSPCIQVRRPDGTIHPNGTHCGSGHAFGVIVDLDQTGLWTIFISDGNADDTGTYNLVLDRLAPTSPGAVALEYGARVSDEINPVADRDLFRFAGAVGERIFVNTARTSGGVSPCLQLYRPDATVHPTGTHCGSGHAFGVIVDLDQAGEWTILISDGNSDDIGSYTLVLDRLAPTSPIALPIEYGPTVSGLISPVGDVDLFVVAVGLGTTLTIGTTRVNGGVSPCILFYDPAGQLVASSCGSGHSFFIGPPSLQVAGDYTVYIADGNSDDTGEYSLTLQCITAPCPPADVVTITMGPQGSPNPVASGGAVALSVEATDSQGHDLTYAWSASCPGLPSDGSFSEASAQNPTWTAPENTTGNPEACAIQVTAGDEYGHSQSRSYDQGVAAETPPSDHDLAVTKITAPATVTGSAGAAMTRPVSVQIQNRSPHNEVLPSAAILGDGKSTGLVRLTVSVVDDDGELCGPAGVALDTARNAAIFRNGPKILKPKDRLTINYRVTYDCEGALRKNPADGTAGDYSHAATVFHEVLGGPDGHPDDDTCPHNALSTPGNKDPLPDGKVVDKGCGARKPDKTFGGPILTDVTRK